MKTPTTPDEIAEFNKRCAEILGLEKIDHLYLKPNSKMWLSIEEMHFHDSKDWSDLLVKKFVAEKKKEDRWQALDLIKDNLWRLFGVPPLWAAAYQISQAALSAMEGEG